MAKKSAPAVKWIRIFLMTPIVVNILLYLYLVYLIVNQPVGGYLPTGGIHDFHYGFIERMYGRGGFHNSFYTPPLMIKSTPGYLFGLLLPSPLITGLTLLAFNMKKKRLFQFGAILMTLFVLGGTMKGGVIITLSVLILSFRQTVQQYFKNK